MLIDDVRPTTLKGVKSLAAQLRKQQGIPHSAALDLAAQAADCSNFRNAQNVLAKRERAQPYVLLTIYWCDTKEGYRIGRETLRIELSKPVLDICGKFALKSVRGFGNLRMVAPDHFVCDDVAATQSYARARLCTAERSLRFIERTGLQPSRDYRKAYPKGSKYEKLPSSDHATKWFDPAAGQFILIDEPYSGVPDEKKRANWAVQTGWNVQKTSWPGMYNPYSCDLYVATDGSTGYDIDALVAKIDAMPPPLQEMDWEGESCPSWDTFVSPMAKSDQDIRRARCRGTIYPAASATSVPYSFSLGSRRRRPIGKLGIEGHIAAGRIIKAVLRSKHRPYGVYTRMDSVRSTLEDWMGLEIERGQLEGPEFFDVYYHELNGDVVHDEMASTAAGLITGLRELKTRLLAEYSDCAPLRQQIHRIDMSIKLIVKMKPDGA